MTTSPEFTAAVNDFTLAVEVYNTARQEQRQAVEANLGQPHPEDDTVQVALALLSTTTIALEGLTESLVAAVSALVVEVHRLDGAS